MSAERDVARILHHVRQEIAKHRVFERVEIDVALPHLARTFRVALGVGVEHVFHQFGGDIVHVPEADDRPWHAGFGPELDRTLGDVLGEIADPLEVVGDANRADQLAQINRHGLAACDGHHGEILDLALQRVETGIGGDDLMGEHRIGAGERVHGLNHHLFGDAAHFGDQAVERVELPVIGFDGVVVHGAWSFCRKAGNDGVRFGETYQS